VGDHGCEYMTGGRVVVIGPTGRNFAAGMSGGIAFVYDDDGTFPRMCNRDQVELERLERPDEIELVRRMLENHARYTRSTVAAGILGDWEREIQYFVRVIPTDYRRVLDRQEEIAERARQLAQRQVK